MSVEGQMVIVTCSNAECGKRMRVPTMAVGKKIRCLGCKAVTIVPRPPEPQDEPVVELDLDDVPERDSPPSRRHHEPETPDALPRKRRRKRRQQKSTGNYNLDLAKKQIAGVLFAIAGMQLICGGFLLSVASAVADLMPPGHFTILVVAWLTEMLIFLVCGIWACFQPLPAGSIGMAVYVLSSLYALSQIVMQIAAGGGGVMSLVTATLIRLALISALGKGLLSAWGAKQDE